MKVLLIEDDPIFQQMYKDEFAKNNIELTTAIGGKDGIVEAVKQKPDFILLDIMMPNMDGITAFGHLQKMSETKNIPVAFLTVVPEGVPQSLHQDQKMLEGAVGYWPKDKYTPMQIVSMIKKHLNNATII